MIKYFRHIRQSLLKEDKFSSYLMYAVGEIALVMIGILLALQVNNWNQNRIQRNQEVLLLKSLHSEFSDNQIILTNTIKDHKKVVRLLKELATNIHPNPPVINDDRLDSLMFVLGWLPAYSPKDGVINSLLASGKISLIQNSVLSSKLAAWNSLINEYKTAYEWSIKDVFEIVVPYIKDKYPLRKTLKYFQVKDVPNSEFTYASNILLSDMGFETIVSNRLIDANDMLRTANKIFEFQDEVVALIQEHLQS